MLEIRSRIRSEVKTLFLLSTELALLEEGLLLVGFALGFLCTVMIFLTSFIIHHRPEIITLWLSTKFHGFAWIAIVS